MEEARESLILNYVCPRRFRTVDECGCDDKAYYPLWWIDRNVQEHIRLLNEKGYKTQYCCESHGKNDNLYISFFRDHGFGKGLPAPDGFKVKHKGKLVEHLYGEDSRQRKRMTQSEFEAEKVECLNILLDWVKNLPDNEKGKARHPW